ncbi:Alcohol dehydrogenase [NADP(+)] A [Holothuria leucospilota]|uniref:Alcohol dehydrogenase [NADP(+)] A n=1 Tax=Holothuria leucospilota TaxID=206669 RepID=A0A9Q1BRG3_HOLLE|nr:Alcohol dehydrogenase [NADP(+)] A [Holothuria leucospilota]
MNEDEVGEAIQEKIKDGTVKRDELFITTKLWGIFHNPDKVEHALRLSLAKLQVDSVDLYLMHSPMALGAMEKLVEKGLTKSIGVSNFNVNQLGEIIAAAKVPCVMNQVENHPCLDQSELINFCKTNNIAITAYSPLGSSRASAKDPNLRENSLVKEIAENKACTPVQVLLAYHICQGIACLAKSVTPSRIEQNFSVSVISSRRTNSMVGSFQLTW